MLRDGAPRKLLVFYLFSNFISKKRSYVAIDFSPRCLYRERSNKTLNSNIINLTSRIYHVLIEEFFFIYNRRLKRKGQMYVNLRAT